MPPSPSETLSTAFRQALAKRMIYERLTPQERTRATMLPQEHYYQFRDEVSVRFQEPLEKGPATNIEKYLSLISSDLASGFQSVEVSQKIDHSKPSADESWNDDYKGDEYDGIWKGMAQNVAHITFVMRMRQAKSKSPDQAMLKLALEGLSEYSLIVSRRGFERISRLKERFLEMRKTEQKDWDALFDTTREALEALKDSEEELLSVLPALEVRLKELLDRRAEGIAESIFRSLDFLHQYHTVYLDHTRAEDRPIPLEEEQFNSRLHANRERAKLLWGTSCGIKSQAEAASSRLYTSLGIRDEEQESLRRLPFGGVRIALQRLCERHRPSETVIPDGQSAGQAAPRPSTASNPASVSQSSVNKTTKSSKKKPKKKNKSKQKGKAKLEVTEDATTEPDDAQQEGADSGEGDDRNMAELREALLQQGISPDRQRNINVAPSSSQATANDDDSEGFVTVLSRMVKPNNGQTYKEYTTEGAIPLAEDRGITIGSKRNWARSKASGSKSFQAEAPSTSALPMGTSTATTKLIKELALHKEGTDRDVPLTEEEKEAHRDHGYYPSMGVESDWKKHILERGQDPDRDWPTLVHGAPLEESARRFYAQHPDDESSDDDLPEGSLPE